MIQTVYRAHRYEFGQTLRKRKDHLCQTSHLQQTYGKTL